MRSIRILLADDFGPWRSTLRLILSRQQDLDVVVIGEASNGLEAIQMAQELQPDLLLLDIAMPELNGIEVARGILRAAPKPVILFITQESTAAVAEEALRTGALGYVVKTAIGSELLIAIQTVLGERDSSAAMWDIRTLQDPHLTDLHVDFLSSCRVGFGTKNSVNPHSRQTTGLATV